MAAAVSPEAAIAPAVRARPAHVRHSPWAIALTVTMATFMELLDTSISNVSLPHIAGGPGTSYDEATWVLTSYRWTQPASLCRRRRITTFRFVGRKPQAADPVGVTGVGSANRAEKACQESPSLCYPDSRCCMWGALRRTPGAQLSRQESAYAAAR